MKMDSGLSSLGRSGKDVTDQSIVRALDEFMGAMNRMQEVVMIPSRLKDVEAPMMPSSAPPSRASSSAALSISPSPPPSLPLSTSPSSLQAPPSQDLFTYFRMLDTLKQELMSGDLADGAMESTDDELSSLDSLDLGETHSARLAASFRHHLQGLHSVIHTLTATANTVSESYQHSVSP